MSWLGDVGSFESFNLKKMLGEVADHPDRILYGSADPFSTKVWNGILGTDYDPVIDQYGGAAPQRYEEAQKAGINTGPGATMHGVARTIASMFAGGAAGNALGGAGSAAGTGAGTAGTAAGEAGTAGSQAFSNGLLSGGSQVNLANSSQLMSGAANPYMASATGGTPTMASTPGLLSQFKTTYGEAKPYMDAAKNVKQTSDMFQPEQKPMLAPPPLPMTGGNNQVMNSILEGQSQAQMQNAQADAERRARRYQLIRGG